MKYIHYFNFKTALTLVAMLLMLIVFAPNLHAQVTIIVNKNNSTNALSMAELKNILFGDVTKFSDGTTVVIANYKEDNTVRKKLYAAIGKSHSQFMSTWLKKALNDGAKPPAAFASEDDVLAFVAKTPGAISFVSSSAVNGSIKVVAIDGKKQLD